MISQQMTTASRGEKYLPKLSGCCLVNSFGWLRSVSFKTYSMSHLNEQKRNKNTTSHSNGNIFELYYMCAAKNKNEK